MKCIICNGHHPNTEGLNVCTGGMCRRMRIEQLEQQLKKATEVIEYLTRDHISQERLDEIRSFQKTIAPLSQKEKNKLSEALQKSLEGPK